MSHVRLWNQISWLLVTLGSLVVTFEGTGKMLENFGDLGDLPWVVPV